MKCVALDIKELHELGFAHRRVTPDTIVMNVRPLDVRLICFKSSFPALFQTRGTVSSCSNYAPVGEDIPDGSPDWDIYALAAIALECDLEKGAFKTLGRERSLQWKAHEHASKGFSCDALSQLLRETVLRPNGKRELGIDDVI